MRKAISPRLAMRIFPNMVRSADDEEVLAVFDGLTVSTQISLTTPSVSASTSFKSFMASMMQTV